MYFADAILGFYVPASRGFVVVPGYEGYDTICSPVAQLVEHRAFVWEARVSTLAPRDNWGVSAAFCSYTRKWLDLQVFSDKDYKP